MTGTLRRSVWAWVALLVGSGCTATQGTLDKWNRSSEERVWIEVEEISLPRFVVYWRMRPRGGALESGRVWLSPPLTDCERPVVYPLRRWGRVEPIGPYEIYSDVHHSRIPDSAEAAFWRKVENPRCAVLLTLGLPEEGSRSLLRASTVEGSFASLELHRTVRPEWALALPAAAAADVVRFGVMGGGSHRRTEPLFRCTPAGRCEYNGSPPIPKDWDAPDVAAARVDLDGLNRNEALIARAGATWRTTVGGYTVASVLPDTPAARVGLKSGDRPVNPVVEGPLSLAEFIARIEAGEEVTVERWQGSETPNVVLNAPVPGVE